MILNIEKNISGKYRIRHAVEDMMIVNPAWTFREFGTIEEAEKEIRDFIIKDKWKIVKSINSAEVY
jgi:hypothetical protein